MHARAAYNTTITTRSNSAGLNFSPRTRTFVAAPIFHSSSLVPSKSYWPHIISTKATTLIVHCICLYTLWQHSGKYDVSVHPLAYLSFCEVFYNLSQITSLLSLQSPQGSHHTKLKPKSLQYLAMPSMTMAPNYLWGLISHNFNSHYCFIITYASLLFLQPQVQSHLKTQYLLFPLPRKLLSQISVCSYLIQISAQLSPYYRGLPSLPCINSNLCSLWNYLPYLALLFFTAHNKLWHTYLFCLFSVSSSGM